MTVPSTLSAKVTYAVKLYLETVEHTGPRTAYAAAVELAGLQGMEKRQLREAIDAQSARDAAKR